MKGMPIPLWLFGLICVAGSAAAIKILPKPATAAEGDGQMVGILLVMLFGVGLIVMHFVNKRKSKR